MKIFRLASYSHARFHESLENNLEYLEAMLEFNERNGFGFYRISSDLVPFGSHPILDVNWRMFYAADFARLGRYIKELDCRISMHPGQYTLLNSQNRKTHAAAVLDLLYHCDVLDLLGLDETAKVQIHVGGVYGDKEASLLRFLGSYKNLPQHVQRRLVVEDDEYNYSLSDCLRLHESCGVPVLFDTLHHSVLNNGESMKEGLVLAAKTWSDKDGVPMVDYSSQEPGARVGTHCQSIDVDHFRQFLRQSEGLSRDVMLEIKDKENSALIALKEVRSTRPQSKRSGVDIVTEPKL